MVAEVFREELAAALHGENHVHFGCEGYFGALFYHYGILSPYSTFTEGCYNDGDVRFNKISLQSKYRDSVGVSCFHPQVIEADAIRMVDHRS